jgi:hypothetical protein
MQVLNGIAVPQTLAEAAAPDVTALVVYEASRISRRFGIRDRRR